MGKFSKPRDNGMTPEQPEELILPTEPAQEEPAVEDSIPEVTPIPAPAEPPKKAAVSAKKKNKKIMLISLCSVAAVLLIGIIASLVFIFAIDPNDGKILNNVTIAGVHVGGMTRSEAEDTVAKNLASAYGSDMVIALPDETIRLSPANTGAVLDIKAAVKAAYSYGRTGTEEERQAAYQASHSTNHTIGLLPYLELNQEYIYLTLQEYADQFGTILTQSTYELEGEMPALEMDKFDESAPCQTLMVTIGTPGLGLDID